MFALRTALEDRGCLPPELRAGLFAVQSDKDKGFPQAKVAGLCTAQYKSLGFPKPGSSPVTCPTEAEGVIWPCLATLWNWDLRDKHRTVMMLWLLLLLRCLCVCVCGCGCGCVQACVSTRALLLSHVQIFAAPGIVAHQAPLSMGFSRQEYWSELPFPTPEDVPNQGIKPSSLVSPSLAGGFFTTEPSGNLLCL